MLVGQRVSYSGELCTIRYVGEVTGTKGKWLGVEWDDPTRGKHDGEAGGQRYFTCRSKEPKAASFIRPNRPADKERDFLEALRFKYASEHIKIIQIGQPPASPEKSIRFGTKEAEEVGFDKIRKKQAELHDLKVVLLDGLCIRQPLPDSENDRRQIASDIQETCPNIRELDLSRNLFDSIHEVAAICAQLKYLKILRLDGNRFGNTKIKHEERDQLKATFAGVETLSLDSTLLSWMEIVDVCLCFPSLKSLSISSNEFDELDNKIFLSTFPAITTIKLESNRFTKLSDIIPLARIPSLRQVVLKYNNIQDVSPNIDATSFGAKFTHITDLDVSYNAITSWAFINDLATFFPSLTALRISHNPLYTSLHSPLGKELTADDGYMLTIARLPGLKTLNFSAITEKDRLNAETYYLSLIVQELSLKSEEDAADILKGHPRWTELCEEYGEPTVKRDGDHIDPRSLAARLLTLEFELSSSAAALFAVDKGTEVTVKNIPKRFNIYSVLGCMAKGFGQTSVVPGLHLSLITDDWEEIDGQRVKREVRLVPETRGIGTFVEERIGHVRVDYIEPDMEELSMREHVVAGSWLNQIAT